MSTSRLTHLIIIFIIIIIIIAGVTTTVSATDHIVGANRGWNPGINYTLWANNHTFYVGDFIWVSPLVGLRETGFVAGQASRKAESKKVDKHAKACAENQHVFIPLAFDTFGSLAPEAIRFLTRVQQVVHSNSSSPEGQGFVFSRLGFAIQKGVAAQLVARLPSIVM